MNELDLTTLVTGYNLILAGGSFGLTSAIRAAAPEFFEARLGKRLLPLLPVILAVVGAVLGVCEGAETLQARVMLGILIGFFSGHLFKLGKTSVMGAGLPERRGRSNSVNTVPDNADTENN